MGQFNLEKIMKYSSPHLSVDLKIYVPLMAIVLLLFGAVRREGVIVWLTHRVQVLGIL